MQDRGLKQSLYAVLKGTNLYAHTRSYWPWASKHITHLKLGFCNAETPSFAVNGTESGSCGAGPEEAADPPLGTAPVEQRVPLSSAPHGPSAAEGPAGRAFHARGCKNPSQPSRSPRWRARRQLSGRYCTLIVLTTFTWNLRPRPPFSGSI